TWSLIRQTLRYRPWSVISKGAQALLMAGFSISPPFAAENKALSTTMAPLFGRAYPSERQDISGAQCVVGAVQPARVATSTFSFVNSLKQSEASNQLGLEVGGRAQFGAVSASASAKFFQSAVSSSYSVSSVWLSDYRLPADTMVSPTLTAVGTALKAS